jgi:DNA-binding NarL/FixJ family response regulator
VKTTFILLVDDSPLILRRMKSMLKEFLPGTTVLTAENGDVALGILGTTPINIVLLDIKMPGKSGIEVLKIIKATHPAIKVIMVTNEGTGMHQSICMQLGAHAFVDKTGDFENIPHIIRKIIE